MAMTTARRQTASHGCRDTAPVSLKRILVALDASEHADRALTETVRLAGTAEGVVTGIHAYAAKLHDRRFRQMEGGLPERYRAEAEIEKQREVHDTLITRGLNIISDSYHDVGQAACEPAKVPYRRLSPEGKNYARLIEAASSGAFDVLALGAVGLGAVPGSPVGTVCSRVVRRCPIDTLVIRDAKRAIGDGPIVVALDGSSRSFGALKTGLDIARRLGLEIRSVAAYDPYYHYVAFNKIGGVLSEEAGKLFRFREQERLHEELIDEGIAKIYRSHLDVAHRIALDAGVDLETELLDGKPYKAIADYLKAHKASLLLLGKTGVHADAGLDIGGNAENLVRLAPCHVWLCQTVFTPPLDIVAEKTIAWTDEAERKMENVPERARAMVRTAILRFARQSGHTCVTSALIEEATSRFCPHFSGGKEVTGAPLAWSAEAEDALNGIGDASVAEGIRLRAEKRARRDGAAEIRDGHVRPFLDGADAPAPKWSAAALAQLARVPELVRAALRRRAEADAAESGFSEVTPAVVEAAIEESRCVMQEAMRLGGHRLAAKRGA